MDFKQFSLAINHTKVSRFVDDLAAGKIMATRCKKCQKNFYPPRADCAICMSSEMEWIELKGSGKLATYTTINVPPDHFTEHYEKSVPFAKYRYQPCPIGILEMENGIKIMGWIPEIKNISVGMELEAVPAILPDEKRITIVLKAP